MNRLLPALGRTLITLILILCAVVALIAVWRHYEDDPWTRDGAVEADVVQVAADVSGLVTQIRVHDNQNVHAGDILFTVDQDRYAADLAEADASIATSEADIASAQAAIADSRATLANDERDARRYLSLGNLVSAEQRDEHITTVQQDQASLQKSVAQLDQARASLKQSEATRALRAVDVQRSFVRAGVNGYVTGFTMRPGDYVDSGSPQFALLDTDSYYILAYLEETKIDRFRLGDRARIDLLGESRPLWGHVDSLSAGVTDRQQNSSDDLLPNITPTFSWIRLAQRVPVRVVIDKVPAGVRLIAGRTATVTIMPELDYTPPKAIPATPLAPLNAPANRAPPPPIGQPGTGATQ